MAGASNGRTVLVVDDEVINRIWLASVIRKSGYHCFEADNGEMGLWMANELLPDVIVLDVQMPGMDGIEVSTRLRKRQQTASIPTLFVSASGDAATRAAAFDSGALQFADKPIGARELMARVRSLMALIEQREQGLTRPLGQYRSLADPVLRQLDGTCGR